METLVNSDTNGMMGKMTEEFIPQLNAFTGLLNEARSNHAAHIRNFSEWQKDFTLTKKIMVAQLELEGHEQKANPQYKKRLKEFLEHYHDFEKAARSFHAMFQQHIDDANFAIGSFSNLWGGYIENIAVQYMLNSLRKDYGVHTWFQKFKRYWHKSKNVEIDLLALSDTHAYIAEVKNQLKEECFYQMLTILDKMTSNVPEYNHLRKQPIILCMHADPKLVRTAVLGNLWILRYKGFDRQHPQASFEWLRKD